MSEQPDWDLVAEIMVKFMKQEIYETLKSRYPNVFRIPDNKAYNSLGRFGLQCGPGWYNIINELCQNIENEIKKQDDKTIFYAVQIKEKFGGLRFYMHCSTYEMDVLIDHAQERSLTTCEQCGKEGALINRSGWLRTLCPDCQRH